VDRSASMKSSTLNGVSTRKAAVTCERWITCLVVWYWH